MTGEGHSGSLTSKRASEANNPWSVDVYSIVDSESGMARKDRVRRNLLHFATNAVRYEGFPRFWGTFTMFYRLCQNYSIFLFPSSKRTWPADDNAGMLVRLMVSLFRCEFNSANIWEYARVDFPAFILVMTALFIFARVVWRDPVIYSVGNRSMFFFHLLFTVLVPIGSIWIATFAGKVYRDVVFLDKRKAEDVIGFVMVTMSMIAITMLRYAGSLVVQSCASLDFEAWLRPWAMNTLWFAHLETYFGVLSFFEGFLDLDVTWQRIGFGLMCMIVANPIVATMFVFRPFFQSLDHTPHFAVQFVVGFALVLFIDLKSFWNEMHPATILVFAIIIYVMAYVIIKYAIKYRVESRVKALYTAYKRKSPGLVSMSSQVQMSDGDTVISNEAYAIVEAFESLHIKTANEFRYYLAIGTAMCIPAIRNMDFIKWGLKYFHDTGSLVVCQHICQHFGSDLQTKQMLIQRLRDRQGTSLRTLAMLHCMELHHGDTIISEPQLLRMLLAKAGHAMLRCRRTLNRFWGSVLKRRPAFMQHAICEVRDVIAEADTHFDELMRCYPMAKSVVELNLTFMTEIKGRFVECSQYMNTVSKRFIEKFVMEDEDARAEKMSAACNDPTRLLASKTTYVRKRAEHERVIQDGAKGMPRIVRAITILTCATILLYSLIMTVVIELSFGRQPPLIDVIVSGSTVTINIVRLLLGIRRLCFYGYGLKDPAMEFEDCYVPFGDDSKTIVPYLTSLVDGQLAESLDFYRYSSNYNLTMKALDDLQMGMAGYADKLYRVEGLAFLMDDINVLMRNAMTNAPKRFGDEIRGESSVDLLYSADQFSDICLARETAAVLENLNSIGELVLSFGNAFYNAGKEIGASLTAFLYFSTTYFPAILFVLFGVMLGVSMFYLRRESGFRLTLFLALPEVAVANLCKNDRARKMKRKRKTTSAPGTGESARTAGTTSDYTTCSQSGDMSDPFLPEEDLWEIKKRVIEGLYQESAQKAGSDGIGLVRYTFWYIITVGFAGLSFYVVAAYAGGVNATLPSWSSGIYYSLIRLLWTELSAVCLGDVFVASADTKLLLSRGMSSMASIYATMYLQKARDFHRALVYGTTNITTDFRVIDLVRNAMLVPVSDNYSDYLPVQRQSEIMLHHDGYRRSGTDLHCELFFLTSLSLIAMVEKEVKQTYMTNRYEMYSSFALSTPLWDEYEHLNMAHTLDELSNITLLYCDHARAIIDDVLVSTVLVVMCMTAIVLLLIFGRLRVLSLLINDYFDTMIHVMILVPPEVLRTSIYINKWLKGQISRSNYDDFQNSLSRSVPPVVQKAAVNAIPEKIMIFDDNGNYVLHSGSYDDEIAGIESRKLAVVIGVAIDIKSNGQVVDDLERITSRFRRARDVMEDVVLTAQGAKGGDVRLTVTGVVSADGTDAAFEASQRQYEFVAILIRDITEEAKEQREFSDAKERTVRMMTQHLPGQMAICFHDSQREHKCVGDIVSLCLMEFTGFESVLQGQDLSTLGMTALMFRKLTWDILAGLPSISVISMHNSLTMLASGIFNEESTGQMEAAEMVQFVLGIDSVCRAMEVQLQTRLDRRFAICTGGPVVYRLLVDTIPQSLITGSIVGLTQALLETTNDGLMIDQTTYHCVMNMGINGDQLENMEYEGQPVQRFRVNMAPPQAEKDIAETE